jgi:hypothetical protein
MHVVHTAAIVVAVAIPVSSIWPGALVRWRVGWVALCLMIGVGALADTASPDVVSGAEAVGWPAVTAMLGWQLVRELASWRELAAKWLEDMRASRVSLRVEHHGAVADALTSHGEAVRKLADARDESPTRAGRRAG